RVTKEFSTEIKKGMGGSDGRFFGPAPRHAILERGRAKPVQCREIAWNDFWSGIEPFESSEQGLHLSIIVVGIVAPGGGRTEVRTQEHFIGAPPFLHRGERRIQPCADDGFVFVAAGDDPQSRMV